MHPYEILSKKRVGQALTEAELRSVVRAVTSGGWTEPQLAAFLMAAAIQGLSDEETHYLTMAMLESGDQWNLGAEVPDSVDKHSTGGVGDKVSLVLAPILAACDVPVVMLTGRALGHTAGTADKLEAIPGLRLELDRRRCLELLEDHRMAIGIATADIAPADRQLYRLRDQTATVESLPLITASILSKKLATGATALVFDVKTGNGAFMSDPREATRLAKMLVTVARAMGAKASALITDMSQPLGSWVGHLAEVRGCFECLASQGEAEVLEVSFALAEELGQRLGRELLRPELEDAVASGRARQVFDLWAEAQGADPDWLNSPDLTLGPHEVVLEAPRSGVIQTVNTRRLGLLLVEAGAGRRRPGDQIDNRVALHYGVRLGERVERGQELARVYLRQPDDRLRLEFGACFEIADQGEAVSLVLDRVDAG